MIIDGKKKEKNICRNSSDAIVLRTYVCARKVSAERRVFLKIWNIYIYIYFAFSFLCFILYYYC